MHAVYPTPSSKTAASVAYSHPSGDRSPRWQSRSWTDVQARARGPRAAKDACGWLLRAAQVTLGEDDLADLHRRTEGWAAGLYLAALYLREGGSVPGMAASFGGDDRFVSEYMRSELLDRIPSGQRAFLTRAAVLERMSGPVCETVLDLPGAGAVLAAFFAAANLVQAYALTLLLGRWLPGLWSGQVVTRLRELWLFIGAAGVATGAAAGWCPRCCA